MAGWTAGGWLAEDPRYSCRLFHLVMGQLQLLHHLLQILLVHLRDFVVVNIYSGKYRCIQYDGILKFQGGFCVSKCCGSASR
jgi:hypothetical protein